MAYEAARWREDPGAKDVYCNHCIHKHFDKENRRVYCDAFPDGISGDKIIVLDESPPEHCNNGIKYERIPDDPQ